MNKFYELIFTNRSYCLTGSSALYLFNLSNSISASRENNLNSICLSERIKIHFKQTLSDVDLKDIDFSISGKLSNAVSVQKNIKLLKTEPGYRLVEHIPSNKNLEFFKTRNINEEKWKVKIGDTTIWTLSIEDVICHNILYHLVVPPKNNLSWIRKIENQIYELINWLEPEEFINKIAEIAKCYINTEAWPILFNERDNSHIAGEVFCYLIKFRGASFLKSYLR